MNELTHFNKKGNIKMVNVRDKEVQHRIAEATGFIKLNPVTIEQIKANKLKKGDVITTAKIAGIQASKKTGELIPLCHQLNLANIELNETIEKDGIRMNSIIICDGKTGVEMEALIAVNISLLTIYDMCKAVDKTMVIEDMRLLKKSKKDINQ